MKVLMAERSDIYHDARVQKEADTLSNYNYDVTVFGLRETTTNNDDNFNFKLITKHVLPRKYRILRKSHLFILIIYFNIRIIFYRADFYHSHNTMFLFGMWLSNKIHKGKLIYDSHEVQWERNYIIRLLESCFIRKVDAIINVSNGRAIEQANRYNIEKKITIISNYPIIKDKISLKYNKLCNIKFIFSGGFSLKNNRLDNFIKVLKNFPDVIFHLLAFGYGNSYQELSTLINSLNLQKRIQFIPLVNPINVIETISEYDFAVNLLTNPTNKVSLNYPSINKIYEYLAAGLPILCSDLPAFKNELVDQGVGISVDPTNLESITNGVRCIIQGKDRIIEMKKKALKLSKSQFNWDTQNKKLLTLYSSLK